MRGSLTAYDDPQLRSRISARRAGRCSPPPKGDDVSEQPERHEEARRAEAIAAEATNVRERIRGAFVDAVRKRRLDLDELGDLAEDMLDGAVAGVKKVVPDRRDSVLRQVVDGLGDGFAASAQATRLALEEARGRGETFARKELDKAARDLKTLQSMFVDTFARLSREGTKAVADQLKDLGEHAARTAERIKPPVQSALAEAVKHPVKLAGETASAGLRAAPRAAGMLLQSVSGLLQGAAEVLAPERDDREGDGTGADG